MSETFHPLEPETITIFATLGQFEDWLESYLQTVQKRIIVNRMLTAPTNDEESLFYHFFAGSVYIDVLHKAVEEIELTIRAGSRSTDSSEDVRIHVRGLVQAIQERWGSKRKVIQPMDDPAIQVFGNLVNRFEAQNFGETDSSSINLLLRETEDAIKLCFGDSSPYLAELKPIRLFRPRAKSRNRERYFIAGKTQIVGLLNRILNDLKLSRSGSTVNVGKVFDIFLSHASDDKELALEIANLIEEKLSGVSVFASTKPDAIPSGQWRKQVISALETAEFLVALITPISETRPWVIFECGYFLCKKGQDKMRFLRYPKSTMPGPLDDLQAKSITNREELVVFFQDLCETLGRECEDVVGFDTIIAKAENLSESKSTGKNNTYLVSLVDKFLDLHNDLLEYEGLRNELRNELVLYGVPIDRTADILTNKMKLSELEEPLMSPDAKVQVPLKLTTLYNQFGKLVSRLRVLVAASGDAVIFNEILEPFVERIKIQEISYGDPNEFELVISECMNRLNAMISEVP